MRILRPFTVSLYSHSHCRIFCLFNEPFYTVFSKGNVFLKIPYIPLKLLLLLFIVTHHYVVIMNEVVSYLSHFGKSFGFFFRNDPVTVQSVDL